MTVSAINAAKSSYYFFRSFFQIIQRQGQPNSLQSAQFFSNTLNTPVGQPSWEGAIHYGERQREIKSFLSTISGEIA